MILGAIHPWSFAAERKPKMFLHLTIFKLARHLLNVGHIGQLVVSSEEAIAKGIRRIVALTGPEAERALQRSHRLEHQLNGMKAVAESDGAKLLINDPDRIKDTGKHIKEFIAVRCLIVLSSFTILQIYNNC